MSGLEELHTHTHTHLSSLPLPKFDGPFFQITLCNVSVLLVSSLNTLGMLLYQSRQVLVHSVMVTARVCVRVYACVCWGRGHDRKANAVQVTADI